MNPQTQDILTRAYQSQSLCALHIDLQKVFLRESDENKNQLDYTSLYFRAGEMAENLRDMGLRNVWAQWSFGGNKYPAQYKDSLPLAAEGEFNVVQPAPYELVLPKPQSDLFGNAITVKPINYEALDYLTETAIITGVSGVACVASTIEGAFLAAQKAQRDLNIIVAFDCVSHADKPDAYVNFLHKNLKNRHNLQIKGNGHFTLGFARSDKIVAHLRALDGESQSTPLAAVG